MANFPTNIEKAIHEFIIGIDRILGNHIKKILLYGSYARGDYQENSDIDIMILTDLTDEEIVSRRIDVWDYAYDIGLDNDVMISVQTKNIDDFNYWIDTVPFYMNVQKEGVELNG